MPTLHIQLLGDFHLTYGEEPVTGITTPRLQSLLAYLVLHRETPQSRQYLAFLFWPDSTEPQARTNLRNLLYRLRQVLPDADDFLLTDRTTVQWNLDASFTLDVDEFEAAVKGAHAAEEAGNPTALRSSLEQAVELYAGDLLLSCYDDWITPIREELYQTFISSTAWLIRALEEQRDYPAAIQYAQHLLQHDPLHEATYRRLMHLHALSGNRARALRVYHTCVTVLERELGAPPGAATQEAYQRLMNHDAETTPSVPPSPPSTAALPLVGRADAWQQLQTAWRRASRGRPHLVLIAGEAGIGKTRLAEELLEWADQQGIATARARSYAAEGELAYAPVAAWFRSDALQAALPALDDVWLIELARVLPEFLNTRPDLPRPGPLRESWQRRRLFEALTHAVLTAGQPLLLVLDDAQWSDQETLEWLRYLLHVEQPARLMVVGLYRPGEVGADHPLAALQHAVHRSRQLTEIELGRLDRTETADLAAHVAGQDLPPDLTARLFDETEGNALFVVETMRAATGDWGLEIGDSNSATSSQSLISNLQSLPPGIQTVIQERLTQLTPPTRELVGLAATIGREFTFDVLAEASEGDEDALVQGLDELWQRRIVREQGEDAYDFSHDKTREVTYSEVSAARRRLLHRRVAQALESVHAADLDTVSGQLAVHYERAGLPEPAIRYYQRAADAEVQICANAEAVDYLTRGLSLLETLPATPERKKRELALQLALGNAICVTRGVAAEEVRQAYARARVLGEQTGQAAQLFRATWGLWAFHLARAEELQMARDLGEQLLSLAEQQRTPGWLLEAHRAVGIVLFFLGELEQARRHLEQAIAIYDPEQHHGHRFQYLWDPGAVCRSYLADVLGLLGYPVQALQKVEEALELARELAHPVSEAQALGHAAIYHMWRRQGKAIQEPAEAAITLSTEWEVWDWAGLVVFPRGWALADLSPESTEGQAQLRAGVEMMRQGMTDLVKAGSQLHQSVHLALLGEVCSKTGQPEEGLALVDEALTVADRTDERYYQAELHRIKGELLLMQDDDVEAEACFHQALDVACRQRAKSLELWAAMSLSRLWQRQGRPAEAYRLLKDVYDWFTEGFDEPDLKAARVLLEELAVSG